MAADPTTAEGARPEADPSNPNDRPVHHPPAQPPGSASGTPGTPGLMQRLGSAVRLLLSLRRHDFRAARTFVNSNYPDQPLPVRWLRFVGWTLGQMFSTIPAAMQDVTEDRPIDRTPIWLAEGNPLANHPWRDGATGLPDEVDTLVIGAGFTGAAAAYHWSKKAPPERQLAVLEMDDPASGASGRNEGLVVMGRYYAMVQRSVLANLPRVRPGLSAEDRLALAHQFAAAYCRAAYRNADMVEQTVRDEGFQCDYARQGWVQAQRAEDQASLDESVRMGQESGYTDWTKIDPAEAFQRSGLRLRHNAGFSVAAASFHPAKWVWCLFDVALKAGSVRLFTRTKVDRVEDRGEFYLVHTTRGTVRARHVLNATEAYTPLLHRQFHDRILPMQTQAAFGRGGPEAMKPHVGISATYYFCGRHGDGALFGSDATRVPDHEAGRMQPSGFLTRFILGQLRTDFGPYRLHLSHEWSGTVSYTPDEFPIVGAFDGKRQYVIGGMAGSGTGVSFNAARCICDRILGIDGEDDYPAAYFAPSRLLDPDSHPWPQTNGDG